MLSPYYETELGKLYHGDCLEVAGQLGPDSANSVVTSPPYYGLRDYGCSGQIGLEDSPVEYTNKIVGLFHKINNVLTKDGTVWLNIGDSYAAGRGGTAMPAETLAGGVGGGGDTSAHRGRLSQVPNGKNPLAPIATYQPHRDAGAIGLKHKDLIGIPWRVAFALQLDGWYLRQDIIWHKPNPMPESVTDRCTKAHEYIFLLSKSGRYFYDADAIRENHTTIGHIRNPEGESYASSGRLTPLSKKQRTFYSENGRNKRSVWTIPTKPSPEAHFATYPIELITPCIMASCPECGTVLDPFFGSGTTGVACERLGRKWIGIEISEEYCEIAAKRIERESKQLKIFEQPKRAKHQPIEMFGG